MSKRLFLIIFLLALTIRLLFIFFYPQQPIKGDSFIYVNIAKNIKDDRGLVMDKVEGLVTKVEYISRGMPGYPYVLGMIFKHVSEDFNIIRIIQALVSSLTCLFMFLWVRLLYGKKIGMMAMIVSAFYPPFISYSGLLVTESISIFIATCFYGYMSWVLTKMEPKRFWIESITFGFFIVVGVFFRSDFIIFLLPILVIGFLSYNKARAIRQFSLVVLFTFLGLSPWVIRNYQTFGEAMPLSRDAAISFWMGSVPSGFTQWDTETPQERNEYVTAQVKNKPLSTSRNLMQLAFNHILNNPLAWSMSCVKRVFKLWIGSHSNSFFGLELSLSDSIRSGQWFIVFVKCALLLINTIIVILGFLMFVLDRKNLIILSPFLFLIITKTMLNSVTVASPRYHLILMPLLIGFACRCLQLMRTSKKALFTF